MTSVPAGDASAISLPLSGRVAAVTGAAGGLGREVVTTLKARGAEVVGVDLHGEDCLQVDIGTAAGNQEMVASILEQYGQLDILVLNAGVQHVAPIAEFADAHWERLVDVMLTGPFQAIRSAWPSLTASSGGRIVVTASTSSFVADRHKAAYVAAKHGVLGLVKVAALEGAEHGLTVNAVAPGWMRTPLVDRQIAARVAERGESEEEVIAEFVDEQAYKRFVELSEVAAAIAFLSGPEASGITGACLPVDLGALA
jgi:3-hydroxybutyrate dehydrogenase